MKRLFTMMVAWLAGLAVIHAMSYEEARDRARFLTDKMAYELNLNEQQYEDAYEINLDYLMNIRTADDVSGVYWEYRTADFRHILYDWQYTLFEAATYFFRPILWRATGWFLPVYTVYTPGYCYFAPPRIYRVYRGGHYAYRHEHRVSFYANRRPEWHGGMRGEGRGPAPMRQQPGHFNRESRRGFRFEPIEAQRGGDRHPNVSRPDNRRNDTRPARQGVGSDKAGTPARSGNDKAAARTGSNGFRFTPVNNSKQTERSRTHNTRPERTNAERPADRLGENSRYNRPSSTRTTVNQKRQDNFNRSQPSRQRQQATPAMSRQATRPSASRPASTLRHSSSAPSSMRRSSSPANGVRRSAPAPGGSRGSARR